MRRARVIASGKAKQKGTQAARSFRLVAEFANDGAICRIFQRVPLGTRADMVTSRAPIRRHRLATVGTWRGDRGPANCPQVKPPLRDLKRPQDLKSGSNESRGYLNGEERVFIRGVTYKGRWLDAQPEGPHDTDRIHNEPCGFLLKGGD